MADGNKKKPINNALEEALKEFEGSGGFDGTTNDSSSKKHENAFEKEFEELPRAKSSENPHDEDYVEYEDDELDQDFDIMEDSLEDDEDYENTDTDAKNSTKSTNKSQKNETTPKKSSGGGNSGSIIDKLKEPKNIVILLIAVCFLLFLLLGGGKKKKERVVSTNIDAEIANQVGDITSQNITEDQMQDIAPPVKKKKQEEKQSTIISELELPSLDITIPEIKTEDADLTPKIPEQKPQNEESEATKPTEINVNEILIRDKNEPEPKQDIIEKPTKKKREPIPQKDDGTTQTLVKDFSGGVPIAPPKTKNTKNSHDFIFMDTDLDTEKEDESSTISAKRIQNPENIISQGRIIDAVLETAVNSSISGQVRAIVTRDVYAEVGKNILIPKGTRLYGEYGSAAGSQSLNGRIVIKWSRIMRPDNVSASIDSYASDQFGRSGIAGQVDNNYFGGVASSMLLSTIPLVTTIVANAITNSNSPITTISGATGSATTVQSPINAATQVFAQSVGKIITDITKNAIDTQPMITLDQGTRVKVLVNKDIKLPTYKSLTKSFGSVSSE